MTAALPLPWLGEPRFRCFGCSPDNPYGLALTVHRRADGRIGTEIAFSDEYASYPGIVHGGVVGVLVDELMGDALTLERGLLAFAVQLRSRLLLPLRIGATYLATAWIASAGSGVVRTEAEVADGDGEVHVMASGSYRPIRSAQARELMDLDDAEYDRTRHYFDHEVRPT